MRKIFLCAILMAALLCMLKFLPMSIWGNDILFDASLHLTFAFWVVYVAWFFIDQTPVFHFPFFLLAILVLFVISIQRIVADAHNDIGLLLGLLISLVSIGAVEWRRLKNKFEF